MAKVERRFHHVLIEVLVLIMLIISASTSSVRKSSSDAMIAKVVELENLLPAVRRIIRSLNEIKSCCTEASVTNVVEITSTTASVAVNVCSNDGFVNHVESEKVDLFLDVITESILRSANGLFELNKFHVHCPMEQRIQNNVVLIVSNIVTIREIEKFLLSSIEIDSSKIFAIIVQAKPIEDIKLMFDVMWRKFTMLNIVIISIAAGIEGEFFTYTIDPFAEDSCGQVHPVAWNSNSFDLSNFHLCSLGVAIFHAPPYMILSYESSKITNFSGIDGNVLRSLATKFNFTLNLTYVPEDIRWGEVRADMTASGALDLVNLKFYTHNLI